VEQIAVPKKAITAIFIGKKMVVATKQKGMS